MMNDKEVENSGYNKRKNENSENILNQTKRVKSASPCLFDSDEEKFNKN